MVVRADQDLNSQQAHLSSASHDMRISNLARFILHKIQISNTKFQTNSKFQILDKNEKLSLLDVGAGNGLFLKYFKERGFQVSGYELEAENVANMKKDPLLKNEAISKGDITKMTGMENYDLVIASDVIEHIENDVLAIKNLWSFVKPDGMMLITVPAHAHLFGRRDVMWGHHRRYDPQLLLDRIKKAIGNSKIQNPNFKVEFITQWNIVGYFVYFLFEKILHKPINEKMRYSPSLFGRISRFIVERILQIEELIGGLPLGLTLVVGVRKTIR